MLLKNSAVIFVKRPSGTDKYHPEFDRYELHEVMVFEKQAVGSDNRDAGSCVIYYFPARSRVTGGKFPEIRPGDLCVAGKCSAAFDPLADSDICRRITSVAKRTNGTERTHHIVIEAV